MKRVILAALLTSAGLMAAGNTPSADNGAKRYMQKCAVCHGPKADKAPITKMKPIAGMKAEKVARILVNYQNDADNNDLRISHGYSQEMVNSTVYLSQKDIDDIALYVSSLK